MEKEESFPGASNNVDVSPQRIEKELAEAAAEENLVLTGPPLPGSDDAQAPEAAQDLPAPDYEKNAINAGVLLSMLTEYGLKYLAPAWQITRDQCAAVGMSWGKVAAKYLPASVLRYLPDMTGSEDGSECVECDALMTTLQVFEPVMDSPRFFENSETRPESKPETRPEIAQPVKSDAMPDIHGGR